MIALSRIFSRRLRWLNEEVFQTCAGSVQAHLLSNMGLSPAARPLQPAPDDNNRSQALTTSISRPGKHGTRLLGLLGLRNDLPDLQEHMKPVKIFILLFFKAICSITGLCPTSWADIAGTCPSSCMVPGS